VLTPLAGNQEKYPAGKKLSDEVLFRVKCRWSAYGQTESWWHCHTIISCSIKIQNGLPFWCKLTQVVLEKAI